MHLNEIGYVIYDADVVEVIWVLVTVIAVIVNFLLLDIAIKNTRILKELNVNGVRGYASTTQMIREIIRMVKQLALLAIGIRAASLPNYSIRHTWDYYLFVTCLLIVAVGMAVSSIVDWHRFRVLIREAEARGLMHEIPDGDENEVRRFM